MDGETARRLLMTARRRLEVQVDPVGPWEAGPGRVLLTLLLLRLDEQADHDPLA